MTRCRVAQTLVCGGAVIFDSSFAIFHWSFVTELTMTLTETMKNDYCQMTNGKWSDL